MLTHLYTSDPPPPLWSHFNHSFSVTSFLPWCSLNMPSTPLPQGLCTCHFLYQVSSYLDKLMASLLITFSSPFREKSAWSPCENHLSLTQPLLSIPLTCLHFSLSITTWNITYLLVYVAIAYPSTPPQLECKFHKGRDLFLFTSVSLVFRIMAGT